MSKHVWQASKWQSGKRDMQERSTSVQTRNLRSGYIDDLRVDMWWCDTGRRFVSLITIEFDETKRVAIAAEMIVSARRVQYRAVFEGKRRVF